MLVACIHPGSQADGYQGYDDAGYSYLGIQVDVVCVSVSRNEMSERKNPAADNGNGCQHHQRESHGQRAFVRCMVCVQFFVFSSPEDAVIQTEHVECGHTGNNRHNPSHYRAELEAGGQNLVLREEARERRNTCNRQTGNEEGDVGNRHILAQAAHGRHLVAVNGMDDASGAEEQQSLEHGVSEQVEHACHVSQSAFVRVGSGADAQGYHHETDL